MNRKLARVIYSLSFALILVKGADAYTPLLQAQSTSEHFILATLSMPPDPGEAGKLTKLGIDSDGNGVRDDVQRYIIEKYDESEYKQLALFQYAVALQLMLSDAENKEKTFDNSDQLAVALRCVEYVWGSDDFYMVYKKDIHKLNAKMFNTKERVVAWFKANGKLSGKVTTVTDPTREELKKSCEFLPDE